MDVVRRIERIRSEDQKDCAFGVIVLGRPDQWRYIEPYFRVVEEQFLAAVSVVNHTDDGSFDTHEELFATAVSMLASDNIRARPHDQEASLGSEG
jgi:hypothetical protein